MRRFLGVITAAALVSSTVLGMVPVNVRADEPETITGTFTFGPHDSKVDLTDSYEYSDTYFLGSGYVENMKLAVMSMEMASASISSEEADYPEKSRNVQDLLGQLGFNSIEVNDYYKQKMQQNTMGVAVAYKEISDGVVLAVVPRSAGYENEWTGNFVVGENGVYHEGFDIASNIVLDFAKDYVARHSEVFDGKCVKVWTMGYSRGAAVANLIGAKLCAAPDYLGVNVNTEDIYDYTFGTPSTTTADNSRDEVYGFIHNYYADYDPVAMAPFAGWGFTRYGVDRQLDVHDEATKELFYTYLKNTNETVYNIYTDENDNQNPDRFEAKTLGEGFKIVTDTSRTLTQKELLEERIAYLTKYMAPDRGTYYREYQTAISVAIGLYLGAPDEAVDAFAAGVMGSDALYPALTAMMFYDYIESYCNMNGLDTELPVDMTQNYIQSILPAPGTQTDDETVNEVLASDSYRDFYNSFDNGYSGVVTYGDYLEAYQGQMASYMTAILEDAFNVMYGAGYTDEYNQYHILAEGENPAALAKFVGSMLFGIEYTQEMGLADVLMNKVNQVCTLVGNGAYMRVHNNEIILSWVRAMEKLENQGNDEPAETETETTTQAPTETETETTTQAPTETETEMTTPETTQTQAETTIQASEAESSAEAPRTGNKSGTAVPIVMCVAFGVYGVMTFGTKKRKL